MIKLSKIQGPGLRWSRSASMDTPNPLSCSLRSNLIIIGTNFIRLKTKEEKFIAAN